jgi:hypothetical protein
VVWRRLFDLSDGWGGRSIERARAMAGDLNVSVTAGKIALR